MARHRDYSSLDAEPSPAILNLLLCQSSSQTNLRTTPKPTGLRLGFLSRCPRLLKHIKSQIFPKPRKNLTETIAAFGSSSTRRAGFILDSGASSHFVCDAGMLQDIIYFPHDRQQRVTLADGFWLPIVGIGTLLFNGRSECGTYTRSYRIRPLRVGACDERNICQPARQRAWLVQRLSRREMRDYGGRRNRHWGSCSCRPLVRGDLPPCPTRTRSVEACHVVRTTQVSDDRFLC